MMNAHERYLMVQRMQHRERYDKRKAAGICVKCGKPAAQGSVRCDDCLKKHNKENRDYRKLGRGQNAGPRTELHEPFTKKELDHIINSDDTCSKLAYLYDVIYDQITWIRRHKNEDLTGLRKIAPRGSGEGDWVPLEMPEGDVNKMCGCCKRFGDWQYYGKYGIYGICEADGVIRHRCDFCTADGQYQERKNSCVLLEDGVVIERQVSHVINHNKQSWRRW